MPIPKKSEKGAVMSIVTGVIVQAVCLALLSALASALMLLSENPLGLLFPISLTLMPISAMIASIVLMQTDGRVSVRILSALAFVLILFIVSVLTHSLKTSVLINYLCYIGASGIALLIPKKERRRRRRRKHV